ncbi:hypothetical protein FRACYDRAFT_271261 [Fragilariopsis cylindrus CCMP1102]|uniref:Uncharacterized protein n=1 Tax=Fragilariopsis cylindrus CCMP1102 TaxID=635003 RepID=A0A1E7EVX8_9STRA|nr:hypothetical protein FRACYDRAFT_271261 [Fragilariopsis cylindrus CCMP1102]|eukprot:OEU09693.1 hypothetical protein FRACYDRAFT_271261 [Fragilariopsis cylindrus CCMP1102]
MEKIGEYQSRALRSEGQYKDEVYNAEEGMFQEPTDLDMNKQEPTDMDTIKDSSHSNIAIINIGYRNDMMKENGEQTTCYSNQDPCMIHFCNNILAIESKDSIDTIENDASLQLRHSNGGNIDTNTSSIVVMMDILIGDAETTTSTSNEDETTTTQNGENNNQLDYKLVIALIYDHVMSMIPIQLYLCILLIVTLRVLSQSMGSVKIHKALVKRVSQLNQVSQMRARLESGLVNQTSHESFGFAHPLFGSFFYERSQIPL